MHKLNAHGKLVLGLIVALTSALPLACGSDDSNGVPNDDGGASGKGGSGGAAGKAGAASAGKGGAGKAGSTSAGGGGAPEAGAPAEMGGEGGAAPIEEMGGAGGAMDEMGGAGGEATDTVYEANLDATCTTEGSLNCSGDGAASNKEDCLGLFDLLGTSYPPCLPEQKALVACLASKPATAFQCSIATQQDPSSASAKPETCVDESTAYGDCLAVQP